MKRILPIILLLFSLLSFSQENKEIIEEFLRMNKEQFSLNNSDIEDWIITNEVPSRKETVTHIYIQQQYKGVPIHNAVGNFTISNGKIIHYGISFVSDIISKANPKNVQVNPVSAIQKVATLLDLGTTSSISLLETKSENHFIYNKSGISGENIPIQLVYQRTTDNKLQVSWKLSVLQLDGTHWWDVRIDANTGLILDKNDWMMNCQFDLNTSTHNHKNQKKQNNNLRKRQTPVFTGENYNVFSIPIESPNHGNRSVITNAFDTEASPYGWHDTNGVSGSEYTITRGNNVYAQLDDDGSADTFGFAPDGGSNLTFDFPLQIGEIPETYISASLTNLFYMNNIIHDVVHYYGFNAKSGNFQENNYGSTGIEGDFVIADGQDGRGRNNANFGTPPDGTSPRMQMFIFDERELLEINTSSLIGGYQSRESFFHDGGVPLIQVGAQVKDNTITANFTLIDDGTDTPIEACGTEIINDISGKIVLIQRGDCSIVDKVELVQTYGAVAVVIMNNEPGIDGIFEEGPTVNIPVITISQTDGELIENALNNGEQINATLENIGIDSSFDNGVIAHEYGHGISNRLIGGPANVNCMFNSEQLGEGWSDFFAFIFTMKPTDRGTDARGIGTFVLSQPINGTGVRRFPYSTDMSVNPFTLADVENQFTSTGAVAVHGVGSIWATMLWDLTWAMIDKYGFDTNIYTGDGGNNKTLELVIEGLKLTPCDSGFEAARDAILMADQSLNNGENACLIWGVFARRGLGFRSISGDPDNITDQIAAFDIPPSSILNCALGLDDENLNNFKIYPNPSNGELSISVVNNVGNARVSIYDLTGREVFSRRMDIIGITDIKAENLAAGMYILRINNGVVNFSQKIVIR